MIKQYCRHLASQCRNELRAIYASTFHYSDVKMGTIASQITGLTIVYSTVYSDADHRKHQSSASVAFVRSPVNSPHKLPVTRKMFPFDDVIMVCMMMLWHGNTALSLALCTSRHWILLTRGSLPSVDIIFGVSLKKVQQTVDLPMMGRAMTPMWRNCNACLLYTLLCCIGPRYNKSGDYLTNDHSITIQFQWNYHIARNTVNQISIEFQSQWIFFKEMDLFMH